MQRPAPLARFIDAYCDALSQQTQGNTPASQLAQTVARELLSTTGTACTDAPARVPACGHLDPALDRARRAPEPMAALATALHMLAPSLSWSRRASGPNDAPAFHDGHANAWVVGPGALERRNDVVVGISLLAPHVTYPDHRHPPREVYLVLGEGEWFTRDTGWHSPGIGGVVYHPPNLTHAMRSGEEPLLAVWCLWIGD